LASLKLECVKLKRIKKESTVARTNEKNSKRANEDIKDSSESTNVKKNSRNEKTESNKERINKKKKQVDTDNESKIIKKVEKNDEKINNNKTLKENDEIQEDNNTSHAPKTIKRRRRPSLRVSKRENNEQNDENNDTNIIKKKNYDTNKLSILQMKKILVENGYYDKLLQTSGVSKEEYVKLFNKYIQSNN